MIILEIDCHGNVIGRILQLYANNIGTLEITNNTASHLF